METDKRCGLHPDSNVILTTTPQLKHYGRWDCAECGKFVVWAKSPKTCIEMADRQKTIMNMIRSNKFISDKDMETILKMYSIIHLSLVQEQNWRMLNQKYIQVPEGSFNQVYD